MLPGGPRGFLASSEDSSNDPKAQQKPESSTDSLKATGPKPLAQPTWKVGKDDDGVPMLEVHVPQGQALDHKQGKLFVVPGESGSDPLAALGAPPVQNSISTGGKVEVPVDL